MRRLVPLLLAAALGLGFFAVPRIEAALELSPAQGNAPLLGVVATIRASGSCISHRKRPWRYQFCCDASACPEATESDPENGIWVGTATAAQPVVTLPAACSYQNLGIYQAQVEVGCWKAPTYRTRTTVSVEGDVFDSFANGWTTVTTGAELKAAAENPAIRGIYLKAPAGVVLFNVANPIVINRTTPLAIYGAGKGSAVVPGDLNAPTFRIDNCSRVRFARFAVGTATYDTQDTILNQSGTTCDVELSQMAIHGRVRFAAPGNALIEVSRFGGYGQALDSGLKLDHVGAVVNVLGGDFSSGGESAQTGAQSHILVNHGWLGVWGTSMEASPGTADIKITASEAGKPPHYIAGYRSESNPWYPSAMVEASGNARIVVTGNTGSWNDPSLQASIATVPAGNPTLWLIGNECAVGDPQVPECTSLLRGAGVAGATLIAVSNLIWSGGDPVTYPPVVGAPLAMFRAHNQWGAWDANLTDHLLDAEPCEPYTCTDDVAGFPMPARVSAPHALQHPKMTAAAAAAFGWKNVKTDFGAAGDGIADDRLELQTALDSGCAGGVGVYPQLFVPAGTYLIDAPLKLNATGGACFAGYPHAQTSLQLAGEGATISVIRSSGNGLSGLEIGGGTFHALADLGITVSSSTMTPWPGTYWGLALSSESSNLEYNALLHRLDVSGGHAAVLFGNPGNAGMGSENLGSYLTLRNAGTGWATDSANAIGQWLVDSAVSDTRYTLYPGYSFQVNNNGGSAGAIHVAQSNVYASFPHTPDWWAQFTSDLSGSAKRFYHGLDNSGSGSYALVLHDSTLNVTPWPQSAGEEWLRVGNWSPQTVTLLHSLITGGDVKFPAKGNGQLSSFAVMGGVFSRFDQIAAVTGTAKSITGSTQVVQMWGDSLIQGGDETDSFPRTWTVLDRGKAGESLRNTVDMLQGGWDRFVDDAQYATNCNLPDVATCSFANSLAAFPLTSVVVLQWGSNDVKLADGAPGGTALCQWDDTDCLAPTTLVQQDAEAIDAVLDVVEASGKACVVVVPPPVYGTHSQLTYTETLERGNTLRQIYVAEALEHKCAIADLYQLFLDQPSPWTLYNSCASATDPTGDCVHFDAKPTTRTLVSNAVAQAVFDAVRIQELPVVEVAAATDAALEAGIDECVGLKGCVLHAPAGTYPTVQLETGYKVTAANMPNGFILQGDGVGSTIFESIVDGSQTDAMIWLGGVTPKPTLIRDITFDGNAETAIRSITCRGFCQDANDTGGQSATTCYDDADCAEPFEKCSLKRPNMCTTGRAHMGFSGNSPTASFKEWLGINRTEWKSWPRSPLWTDYMRYGSITENVADSCGCNNDIGPGAVAPFVPCHASFSDPVTPAGAQVVGNCFLPIVGVQRTGFLDNEARYSAKYGFGFGVSNGNVAAINTNHDILVMNNVTRNAAVNAIHSTGKLRWQFNRSLQDDPTRVPDVASPTFVSRGGEQLFVGEWSHDIDIIESLIEGPGTGLALIGMGSYNINVRDVVIQNTCSQDTGNVAEMPIRIAGSATDPPMRDVTIREVDITSLPTNYCDRAMWVSTVDGIEIDGITANGDIRLEPTATGTINNCSLAAGAQVVNNGSAMTGDCIP